MSSDRPVFQRLIVFGHRVAALRGFVTDYTTMLNEALSKALIAGESVIAIHCRNGAGGRFIDVGIDVGMESQKP